MTRLAVLVSGHGSNMQSIIDSSKNGILKRFAQVVLVISNNPNSYAIERAKNECIKTVCVERKNFEDEKSFNASILKELKEAQIDIVCLAGYTKKIGQEIIDNYRYKILNIHPSLLPKFGGKGMYGHYVHEAVVKSQETKSGATVHFVDENYDTGKSIIQHEVDIFKTDSAQDIAKKVLSVE
ncbi:MAG: phosphoribosylglycinamide formyltransferase, partial [Candidatus Peribacteria bacterium]|nr:phosphoribosylglycinamide formyltransferase [Candidatus Peribacteria bacterium]